MLASSTTGRKVPLTVQTLSDQEVSGVVLGGGVAAAVAPTFTCDMSQRAGVRLPDSEHHRVVNHPERSN